MASAFALAWLVASSLWCQWWFPLGWEPREGASNHLESCLGRYSSDALAEWQPPVCFDAVASALEGRLGRVVFTYRCSRLWANWRWGQLDEDVGEDAVVGACRGFLFCAWSTAVCVWSTAVCSEG